MHFIEHFVLFVHSFYHTYFALSIGKFTQKQRGYLNETPQFFLIGIVKTGFSMLGNIGFSADKILLGKLDKIGIKIE